MQDHGDNMKPRSMGEVPYPYNYYPMPDTDDSATASTCDNDSTYNDTLTTYGSNYSYSANAHETASNYDDRSETVSVYDDNATVSVYDDRSETISVYDDNATVSAFDYDSTYDAPTAYGSNNSYYANAHDVSGTYSGSSTNEGNSHAPVAGFTTVPQNVVKVDEEIIEPIVVQIVCPPKVDVRAKATMHLLHTNWEKAEDGTYLTEDEYNNGNPLIKPWERRNTTFEVWSEGDPKILFVEFKGYRFTREGIYQIGIAIVADIYEEPARHTQYKRTLVSDLVQVKPREGPPSHKNKPAHPVQSGWHPNNSMSSPFGPCWRTIL